MAEHACVPLVDFVEYQPHEMLARAETYLADMKRRHTVRDFSDRPVAREIIETSIRAAGLAPSGANHQPWFFAVITDAEMKRQVRAAAEAEERAFYAGRAGEEWLEALAPLGTDSDKPFLEIAPFLIAIFAQRRGGPHPDDDRKNYYVSESVGIATGFLITALHQAGLATLTHTPNPMDFLRTLCRRPANEKPYILLVVGYPADDATVPVHASLKKNFVAICEFV